MKFFIDTAEIDEIKELAATGMVDGVTTNPSLILKSGRDIIEVTREICGIIDGPAAAGIRGRSTPTCTTRVGFLRPVTPLGPIAHTNAAFA